MNEVFVASDVAILDLLRKRELLTVSELATVMEVTPTAVRQRLSRLLAQGFIERTVQKAGRGRPSHRYRLTDEGRRKTGANFADLSMALWDEIREIADPQVRRGLLERISKRLAAVYASGVTGESIVERMNELSELFEQRGIPFDVDQSTDLPVLTALACPYPELAEKDRGICAMERMLFSEVLGEKVRLTQCRLDGDTCCTFEPERSTTG